MDAQHGTLGKQRIGDNLGGSFYDTYSKDSFKQAVRVSWIDGWKIEYMAIQHQHHDNQIATVIIGGAFQNFNAYKYCVEKLFEKGPVILIDLPSLGSNQQSVQHLEAAQLAAGLQPLSVASLSLPDLAALLGRWLDLVQIAQVDVMGLSLGSVVASCFAEQRPDLVKRMVLMGVMQKTRPSWRMLLEESLRLMQEQRMHEFAQAVVLYLVNHARLTETRMSATAKRLFYQQMAAFVGAEQMRYEINCKRLLNLEHVPSPRCEVLVACGEYDSFTLPFENAQFALQCPNMQFALIQNADHLPQLQRRQETLNLFTAFLTGQSIEGIDGIEVLNRLQMQQLERRGEVRIQPQQPFTQLRHRDSTNAYALKVEIVDLNYFGALVHADAEVLQQSKMHYARDLQLIFVDQAGEFAVECLLFEQQGSKLRALFKHGSFEISERLLNYIAQEKQLANKRIA